MALCQAEQTMEQRSYRMYLRGDTLLRGEPVGYMEPSDRMVHGQRVVVAREEEDGLRIPEGTRTIVGNAFSACRGLKSVVLPSGLQVVGELAFGNSYLEKIVLPEGVREVQQSGFRWSSYLREVTLPASLSVLGMQSFAACARLERVEIPPRIGLEVLEMGMFDGCRKLKSVRIPEGVKSIRSVAFRDCVSLTDVSFPDGLREIQSRIFARCSSLTSLTVPDSVDAVDVYAFEDSSLRTLTVRGVSCLDWLTPLELSWTEMELRLPDVPPSRVPDTLELPAARGFAALYREGWPFRARDREEGFALLRRYVDELWDWPGLWRLFLEEKLLSPAQAHHLVERMAAEQKPEQTAALLEYLHRNFPDESPLEGLRLRL